MFLLRCRRSKPDHDPRVPRPAHRRLGAGGLRRAARRRLRQPPLEPGPRADASRPPHVVHLPHRRALDRHERGHHHLHARVGADAAGDDVVAGDAHHPARQRHRAGADDPERACRDEVRRVVPGALPRQLRRRGAQRAGHAARARGVRVVRHPDLDRRPGAQHAARRRVARRGRQLPAGIWISFAAFWLVQVWIIVTRARGHQEARGLVGAAAARRRRGPARVGGSRAAAGSATSSDESARLQTAQHAVLAAVSRRRSPPTSATGRRSASTSPTSRATRRASGRRRSARRSACRRR